MPPYLARVRQPVETGDLPLALEASGVVRGETPDERADPFAQLQREMRGRGSHQLTHVIDCHLAAFTQPLGILGLAHDAMLFGATKEMKAAGTIVGPAG